MVGYSNISRICTRIEKSTPKREVILVARESVHLTQKLSFIPMAEESIPNTSDQISTIFALLYSEVLYIHRSFV